SDHGNNWETKVGALAEFEATQMKKEQDESSVIRQHSNGGESIFRRACV
ncbi:hypothetical protein LINPERHAP2_LOCUS38026, partial [Linum perenne]